MRKGVAGLFFSGGGVAAKRNARANVQQISARQGGGRQRRRRGRAASPTPGQRASRAGAQRLLPARARQARHHRKDAPPQGKGGQLRRSGGTRHDRQQHNEAGAQTNECRGAGGAPVRRPLQRRRRRGRRGPGGAPLTQSGRFGRTPRGRRCWCCSLCSPPAQQPPWWGSAQCQTRCRAAGRGRGRRWAGRGSEQQHGHGTATPAAQPHQRPRRSLQQHQQRSCIPQPGAAGRTASGRASQTQRPPARSRRRR